MFACHAAFGRTHDGATTLRQARVALSNVEGRYDDTTVDTLAPSGALHEAREAHKAHKENL